jgi:hypothetical protein
VPWLVHEPTEGNILFGDVPERDFEGFLELCGRLGLFVMVRPGPYQYSELKYDAHLRAVLVDRLEALELCTTPDRAGGAVADRDLELKADRPVDRVEVPLLVDRVPPARPRTGAVFPAG